MPPFFQRTQPARLYPFEVVTFYLAGGLHIYPD
jgi:hypothetical protein